MDDWRSTSGGGERCAECSRRLQREFQTRNRKDPAYRLFLLAKQRAATVGVEFSITEQDVRDVFPSDWRCPVLGLRMSHGHGKSHDASPTLDRLNPEWGYTRGNIAVMCYRANRAKGALTADEMEKIATWMRQRGLA